MESNVEVLKRLLGQGKMEKALCILLDTKISKGDFEEVTVLSAEYNEVLKQVRLGIIDTREEILLKSRLVNRLMAFLNGLEYPRPDVELRVNYNSNKRKALVIGCSEYEHVGKLRNPINDAVRMAQKLECLGFEVILKKNPQLKDLKSSFLSFESVLGVDDIGLLFFAGHGIQVQGENYLVPVDALVDSTNQISATCVKLDDLLLKMGASEALIKIILLDACRNNPFDRNMTQRVLRSGFAPTNAAAGFFIGYATAPGQVASDGTGNHGLYTGSILEEIEGRNNSINQLFQKVRQKVIDESNGRQVPWDSSSLLKDFLFIENND
ncbi:MAG: caspase family protein [Roseivirga sp.]|nr:caspase family protein [Roseivirga sp.]